MTPTAIAPTSKKERIQSLDILRGIALFGILIINIQSFAMPGAAYLNPSAYGDLTGINKWVWMLSFALADSKMMAIFSILFGAGVILVTERAKEKTGKSAGLHYSRSFWLLVFGLIHAHLIWSGDILVTYALCALFVYFFRHLSPRKLIVSGILLIAVHTIFYMIIGLTMSMWPDDQLAEASLDWAPNAIMIQEEIAAITGSLTEQVAYNSENAVMMETLVFLILFIWRASGLMLIGMALYKLGIITVQKSSTFYKKGMIWGFLIGFPFVVFGIYKNFDSDWAYDYSMFLGPQFNYWGSLGVSFGYICAIMLIAKSDKFQFFKNRMAAVGQMAFTNYITQSIICVLIFWGVGFGLFGQLSRLNQLFIVFGVWTLQFLWSKPWLEKYRFGPLEWLWRTLAYCKKQPFKMKNK